MPTFTIATSVLLDGNTVRANSQTLDVQSFMEYSREVGTSYVQLVSGEDQPTPVACVLLENIGDETATVRISSDLTTYDFTSLPAGAHMTCAMRTDTGMIRQYAARGESATTTIRVIALYI